MDVLSTYDFYLLPLHIINDKLIGLNKLHRLKHGNNAEIVKTLLSMKCQTRKYFFKESTYDFSSRVLPTVALNLSLMKFVKRIRKGYY